jgi:hypothetical protein
MLSATSGILRGLSDILHYRPIINATYSDDGSVQDICRALSMRLREPNAVVRVSSSHVFAPHVDNNCAIQVVFKALLVLHSMIRSGATDNVLSFLGQQDLLRLRNVVGQTWDGEQPLFSTPAQQLNSLPQVTRHHRISDSMRSTWTAVYVATRSSATTLYEFSPRTIG